MNFLFKLFLFLGSLIVIGLFAILITPFFVEWEQYTGDFEREASRVIGQEVRVEGKPSLKILPLPSVSFENVSVGRNDDGSALMIVEQFQFTAELLPFLSGEVKIVDLSLIRPRVNLQVSEAGTIAWTKPTYDLVDPEQVKIESLTVEKGSIVVSGLTGGRTLTLDNINADISARSFVGPWRIDADADVEGVPSQLRIATGTYQKSAKSMRVKLDANQRDRPYKMILDGPVILKGETLAWDGNFSLTPFSKARVQDMLTPIEPLPVSTEGVFNASPRLIEIPEYRLDVGDPADPYTITGSGAINISEEITFRANADGRQIDLDRLREAQGEASSEGNIRTRLTALNSVLQRIPVPSANGIINVQLPAIVAGDTFIRDVSARVRPFGKSWDIGGLKALFPGNTLLEATGRVGLGNDFGFSGKMLLASRQPSGFASWFSGEVDPALRRLKSFGFAADVVLSERQFRFDNLEMRLDDALLKGKMQRLTPQKGQPAIIAELNGNRVNVNDLRAVYSLIGNSDADDADVHDLNVKVRADLLQARLETGDVDAERVDAHVRVRQGTVSVEKFDAANIFGVKVSSIGRVEDVLTKPNGNMKLNISAADLSGLLSFAKLYAGENRFLNALLASPSLTQESEIELELDTRATNEGAKGQVLASGKFGGSDFNIKLGFSGDLSKPADVPFVFNISLQNESPSILMQQFGIEALPLDLLGQVKGPMKFNADLNGRTSSSLTSVIGLTAPGTIVSAQGDIFTDNWSEFDGELNMTVASDDLAPLLVTAGMQMPGLNISDPLLISSNFTLTALKGEFDVTDLKGQVNGNAFNGELKLQREGFVRPKITGSLELDTASLPVIAESVFGHPSGLQNLVQQDTETNFGSAYFGGMDGNIKVKSVNFALGNGVVGDDASTELVLRDGSLDINGLIMGLFGGNFSGSFNLKNNEGVALVGMQLGLVGADGKLIANKLSLGGFSQANINLNGTAETSGRSLQALVANLTGNGIMDFENVGIEGLNPTNLEPILLETGAEDYEIKTENITALVGQHILNSGFTLSKIEAPFSINRGRVRVRNLTQSVGTSQLKGDLELDLTNRSAKLMTELTFDPGRRERVKGVEPQLAFTWEGPVGNSELDIDTDRLESFLSLRAFERSQRRVETLEAQVIEKQRLQRQIAFAFAREKFVERRNAEEILRKQELEQLRLEQEEEEARLKAEEEERKRQEEQARQEAERKQQEEQARQEAERKQQEEKVRQEAERKLQEEQARQEAELKKQEELARQEAERKRLQELAKEQAESKSISSNKLKPLGEPVAVGKHRNRIVIGEPGQPGVIENIEKFLETN